MIGDCRLYALATGIDMERLLRHCNPVQDCIRAVVATGQTWAEMKRLWTCGIKAYTADMWNVVEFATSSLYITTYTLKFVSYFLVRSLPRFYPRYATPLPVVLIIISFPSPTLSFILDLKPSFSANPSNCSLPFSCSGLTT